VIRLLLLVACSTLGACATTYTADRPADYLDAEQTRSDAHSLFGSDASVLADADIERILSYEYASPAISRIALLPFGWSTWSGWSEEMAISVEAIDAQVLQTLRASPRIFDASFLPSILVPEQRTVGHLREAAARYQADLLLVFRSSCRSFQRYRIFGAERSRSYCSVEAVLLDVRTGLVPFSASTMQNFEVAESDDDFNLQETMLRAQLEALANALGEVSAVVVGFVERSGSA
jgi:hypothetical protein